MSLTRQQLVTIIAKLRGELYGALGTLSEQKHESAEDIKRVLKETNFDCGDEDLIDDSFADLPEFKQHRSPPARDPRYQRIHQAMELLWLQGYGFRAAYETLGISFDNEATWRRWLPIWTKIRADNMKMGAIRVRIDPPEEVRQRLQRELRKKIDWENEDRDDK